MKGIRQITPYVPGEQPEMDGLIKLNTNENPYDAAPKVQEVLSAFSANCLKRYSSLTNQDLKEALSSYHSLPSDYFIVGNGSDEILAFAFQAFFNSEEPVLFPDLTYGFYQIWCDLFRIPFERIPVKEDFTIDLADYGKNGGIVLANPNAPTSLYCQPEKIEQLLKDHSDSVVIIDEAYIDFGGTSVANLVTKYENLFVTRTFSKAYSLAGARVGYGIANPKLIQVINAIKNSFNPYSVDTLSEKLAEAAVRSADYYREKNQQLKDTREWTAEQLKQLGYQVYPSSTNFLFVTHSMKDMKLLTQELREAKILVRYFDNEPRLKQFIRVSIGTKEEMETVINYLKQ